MLRTAFDLLQTCATNQLFNDDINIINVCRLQLRNRWPNNSRSTNAEKSGGNIQMPELGHENRLNTIHYRGLHKTTEG
uniref:Uncharacterized protein n=1 Tax=Syphacia muris TaxID=451379 RepID=A0A0N5B0W6_9BILA